MLIFWNYLLSVAASDIVELLLALLAVAGMSFVSPFLEPKDFDRNLSDKIGYLMVCQAWIANPLAFLIAWIIAGCNKTPVSNSVVVLCCLIWLAMFLRLLSLKWHGFRQQPGYLRKIYELIPLVAFVARTIVNFMAVTHEIPET